MYFHSLDVVCISTSWLHSSSSAISRLLKQVRDREGLAAVPVKIVIPGKTLLFECFKQASEKANAYAAIRGIRPKDAR